MEARINTLIFDGYAITIDKDRHETTVVRNVAGVKTVTTIGWIVVGSMMDFIATMKRHDSKMATYYKMLEG